MHTNFLHYYWPLIASLASLGSILINHQAFAAPEEKLLSVPIRWCIIAKDDNNNGKFDTGEDGAPAFTDPGNVGEPDTDNILWRRHERTSESTYIPMARVTFRSALVNIVESDKLHFPIIPDQDTSDPDHKIGDILDTATEAGKKEWNKTVNACVTRWKNDLKVGNIGIIAINVRKFVKDDGTEAYFAQALTGGREVGAEDNAWSLPKPPNEERFKPVSNVRDPVDKTLGHEFGHAMAGLNHVCSTADSGDDKNIMRQGRQDLNGDKSLDNFNLKDSVAQVTSKGSDDKECTSDDTTASVDQIKAVRDKAKATPGCKIDGTNDNCTLASDVQTDLLEDVAEPSLDISMVTATEDSDQGTTTFTHELFLPLPPPFFLSAQSYFVLADLDNNPTTGGMPADLEIPTVFKGAELVTRVVVKAVGDPEFPSLSATPTVWKFQGDAFVEQTDPSIRASVVPRIMHRDGEEVTPSEVRVSDSIVIEFSNVVRGPSDSPLSYTGDQPKRGDCRSS